MGQTLSEPVVDKVLLLSFCGLVGQPQAVLVSCGITPRSLAGSHRSLETKLQLPLDSWDL